VKKCFDSEVRDQIERVTAAAGHESAEFHGMPRGSLSRSRRVLTNGFVGVKATMLEADHRALLGLQGSAFRREARAGRRRANEAVGRRGGGLLGVPGRALVRRIFPQRIEVELDIVGQYCRFLKLFGRLVHDLMQQAVEGQLGRFFLSP